MRTLALLLLLTVPGSLGAVAAHAAPSLVLRAEVEVHDEVLRLMDLSARPLDAEFGRIVLCAAPAPGYERRFDRGDLLREMVRAGVRPVPVIEGAASVTVRRPGQEIAPDALADRVRTALMGAALPPGALDQRYELLRVPALRIDRGGWSVELDGEVPRVGRGSVAVRVRGATGEGRRVFVSLRRELLLPVVRTLRGVEAATAIGTAEAFVDTVWTDDRVVVDERLVGEEADGRWSLRRTVAAGAVLTARDVRSTPVVRRGELVEWVVERNGLRIVLNARSRGDGAVGEWILVQSPFDQRLRRVVVIGPARVADHPPARPVEENLARGGTS